MSFDIALLSVIRARATNLLEALREYDDLPTAKAHVAMWVAELERVNAILSPARLGFAYRVRDEICIYLLENQRQRSLSNEPTSGTDWWWGALDEQLSQRVITRIAGDAEEIKDVLESLLILMAPGLTGSELTEFEESGGATQTKLEARAKYPLAFGKLLNMYRQITLLGRPSTSFWMA